MFLEKVDPNMCSWYNLLTRKSKKVKLLNYKLIRFKEGLICPHCRGTHIVLWGKRKNIQRYRCKECQKLFNDLTGTPLAYTKKLDKWIAMARAMQESLSVRKTAKKLDISISTSFRWRHRLLNGLSQFRMNTTLSGIIEIDEKMFRYSEKGSRHLSRKRHKRGGDNHVKGRSKNQVYAVIARDRTNKTLSFLLEHMSGNALVDQMGGIIDSESQICTDAWRSYQTFANHLNLKHLRLNMSQGSRVIHGVYHIQNVNAYHSRLKEWMYHFHGVATKYLLNYLIWFEHLDDSRKLADGMGEQKLFINAFATYPRNYIPAA
jgi:transposase-like protein/IS1 family transposase